MNTRTPCLLLILAGFHLVAHAQLYKCKSADGRSMFQEVPCAAGTTDMNPRPRSPATEPSMPLPKRDNKPGANWDLGPRSVSPSHSYPTAAPQQPIPAPAPQATLDQKQRKQVDLEKQLADQRIAEERKAEQDKVIAFNRTQRCNQARQQLGVVKMERPVYSFDNKGDRQYVSDANRPATIAAAEKRVAEECN